MVDVVERNCSGLVLSENLTMCVMINEESRWDLLCSGTVFWGLNGTRYPQGRHAEQLKYLQNGFLPPFTSISPSPERARRQV